MLGATCQGSQVRRVIGWRPFLHVARGRRARFAPVVFRHSYFFADQSTAMAKTAPSAIDQPETWGAATCWAISCVPRRRILVSDSSVEVLYIYIYIYTWTLKKEHVFAHYVIFAHFAN